MDEPRGMSSYLKNPLPFFKTTTSSFDEANIRAAVAELLVFGFNGMSLNNHARRLISMGEGFNLLPFYPFLSVISLSPCFSIFILSKVITTKSNSALANLYSC